MPKAKGKPEGKRNEMVKHRLSPSLLKKISKKTRKSEQYIREQVSKRANKLGISSEAYLTLWAKDLGFGTLGYQQSLPQHIQEEVRTTIPFLFPAEKLTSKAKDTKIGSGRPTSKSPLPHVIDYLIQDEELSDRCRDLIKAPRNFDRAFREATTVLEDRIKKLSGEKKKMSPVNLVGSVLNPDPARALLMVSEERSEQEGIHSICRGLMLAFRDPTHHELSNKFTREDALKFCGLVDSLLAVLETAKRKE